MVRILADDKIPFLNGVLEPYAEITYMPGNQINKDHLRNADALLIRTRTKCTQGLLKDSAIKFIATATIGFDHIDTQYCESHDIIWTNAPGCNSWSVQQYIASVLLKISSEFRFDLKEKTIGIVGVGNVGSKVEKFARLMGMNILLCDPPRALFDGGADFIQLEKLLRQSDIVTLHVPLNFVGDYATYHLFEEILFKRMKKGAWFINCSRGEVVETGALKKVLQSGKLAGTVLDVWENEPDIDTELMETSFIATPHIAGYSTDGKANGTAIVVNALAEYFRLPLKNWYPENIPGPSEPVIKIDCSGKEDQEIIKEAISHTYDVSEDDTAFRFSPADFEKQRGNYRIRREFKAFSVELKNGSRYVFDVLTELGFKAKLS